MLHRKLKVTTLGLPLIRTNEFPHGCPLLKALHGDYHPEFNEAVQKTVELNDDSPDIILLPSGLYLYNKTELSEAKEKIKQSGLPSLAFNTPFETQKPTWLTHLIQFSWYKNKMRPGIIICPGFLPEGPLDKSIESGWEPLDKDPHPRVGFCGRDQGYPGIWLWKTLPKPITRWMSGNNLISGTKGIRTSCRHNLRLDAISILERNPDVTTNFIKRGKLAQHPHRALPKNKNTFLKNLQSSPYALCARGDENFSWRFYEAMSLGRIPILIDSNCVLPLENEIDWDRLLVRIHAKNLEKLPKILLRRHQEKTKAGFKRWQEDIRETYLAKLTPEKFFPKMTMQLLPK